MSTWRTLRCRCGIWCLTRAAWYAHDCHARRSLIASATEAYFAWTDGRTTFVQPEGLLHLRASGGELLARLEGWPQEETTV